METVVRCYVEQCISAIRSFLSDIRGAAAIEFAMVLPLLLTLYFVTMEAAQGIETNKKVGRIASMVADLVTQQPEISSSEIRAIMEIGQTIIQPYNRSVPTITVTGIDVESASRAVVAWSRELEGDNYTRGLTPGTQVSVPEKLMIPDTFLILVETDLNYQTLLTWTKEEQKAAGLLASFGNIAMGERYYLRPRMSNSIPCTGC
jgi:Flp pilus assembly protein TadG